jgi:hypothetical protein
MAALVIGVAVLAAAIAGPAAAAIAELARAVVIIVIAAVVLAVAAAVALRLHQGHAIGGSACPPRQVPWRTAEPLQEPRRAAIGAQREVHLHFHGASAEDVAAIVTRVNRDRDQDVTQ